jgi:hypothetical protein
MTTTLLENLTRLQAALDHLARALTSGDAEAVLGAEEPLASAVSALGLIRRRDVESSDRDQVRRAIAALTASLRRCESLGRTVQAIGLAMAPDLSYGPRGLRLVGASPVRRLTSTS